jgi:hypothetical protein
MKRTTVILTAVLTAQLALAAVLTFTGNDHAAFKAQEPLLAFDAEAIDQITIGESAANSVTLKKQNGKWVVPASADFPADGEKVKTLLGKLAALKKGWPVATTRDAAERFKLTQKSHERRIAMMSGGKPVATLLGTSPSYRQVHARVDGGDAIFNVAFATYEAGTRGEDWMDDNILATPEDKIASITAGDVTLERKDGKFIVAGLADHEEPVATAVDGLVRAVSHPVFDAVQGKGKDEIAKLTPPDIRITVKRSGGPDITYSYKKEKTGGAYLFASSAQDYVFRVAEANIAAITQANRGKLVAEKKKPETPQTSQTGPGGGSGG